jgi:hypothetical protein
MFAHDLKGVKQQADHVGAVLPARDVEPEKVEN